MSSRSSFKHKNKPSSPRKTPRDEGAKVQLEAVPLPRVLPTSFEELQALLSAQQIIHQAAASAAIEVTERHHRQAIADEQRRHHEQIQLLLDQIRLERQRRFGSSSEQLSNQGRLFDEAEVLSQAVSVDDSADSLDAASIPPQARSGDAADNEETGAQGQANQPTPKLRGKRSPLPDQLERVDIVHDVPLSERICLAGGIVVKQYNRFIRRPSGSYPHVVIR